MNITITLTPEQAQLVLNGLTLVSDLYNPNQDDVKAVADQINDKVRAQPSKKSD
jgi:hypothetical protein